MGMNTAVSLEGDKAYTRALKALAYKKGLTVGQLVRRGLDAQYGSELKPHLDFFVEEGVRRIGQLDDASDAIQVRE